MTAAGATASPRVVTAPANVLVALGCLALAIGYLVALAVYARLAPTEVGLTGSGPAITAQLAALGWDPRVYIGIRISAELIWAVTAFLAAGVILRGATSAFPRWVAVVLVVVATCNGTAPVVVAHLAPMLAGVASALVPAAFIAFFTLAYLFPDGRLVPRWAPVAIAGWVALIPFFLVVWPAVEAEPIANVAVSLAAALLVISAVAAQVVRYRRVSGVEERRRTRLVLVAIVLLLADVLVVVLRPPSSVDPGASAEALVIDLVLTLTASVAFSFLSVAITLAVLRHRLFEIDVIVRRVVVWASLTVFVVGAYLAIVVGLGAALSGGAGGLLPIIATAVVAVAIHPVHLLVRRAVDRWVYGRRNDPDALSRLLGTAVASTTEPRDLAERLGAAVSEELRLGSARILSPDAGAARPGEFDVPLDYQGARLGVLRVTAAAGDRLRRGDARLLRDLAPQLATALQAARSTAELRASRERIVLDREDERRRLHRDLHDGLGPTLASLSQRIEVAERITATDPELARRLLGEARAELLRSLDGVRVIVHDLRPPALDELGVAGALRALWGDDSGIRVVEGPGLGDLPAAVEVAAYRIVAEAVTNALRHGRATGCRVELTADGDVLKVRVDDDGTGIAADASPGTGLASMRSRAEEVGGTLEVAPVNDGGTRVTARLPIGGQP
jgi:signal transduction histidine kinase